MISLIPIDLPLRTLVSTCKVIYLARNPKDVALANFHHHRIARWIFLLKVNVSGVMFRSIPEDMHFAAFFDIFMAEKLPMVNLTKRLKPIGEVKV